MTRLCTLAAVVACLLACAQGCIWNITADFLLHPNHVNPNPGPPGCGGWWHFQEVASFGLNTTLISMSNFDEFRGGLFTDYWTGSEPQDTGLFPTFGLLPNSSTVSLPQGTFSTHPGMHTDSVLTWEAPSADTYTSQSRYFGLIRPTAAMVSRTR